MIKFEDQSGVFWLGRHTNVGLVIYDKRVQQGLIDASIRLLVVNPQQFEEFEKAESRSTVSTLSLEEISSELVQTAIGNWRGTIQEFLSLRHRRPICIKCHRQLDSNNYCWCMKCKWLKCSCGGCGCGHSRMERVDQWIDPLDCGQYLPASEWRDILGENFFY